MSEKWKYQWRKALLWACVLCIGTALLELFDRSASEIFLTWRIVLKFAIYILVGLVIGNFNWKAKAPK